MPRHRSSRKGCTCRRYDCLFHPPTQAKNGCDYCVITGNMRGCDPGKECNKYLKASTSAKSRLQILRVNKCSDEDSFLVIDRKYWQNL